MVLAGKASVKLTPVTKAPNPLSVGRIVSIGFPFMAADAAYSFESHLSCRLKKRIPPPILTRSNIADNLFLSSRHA
jgi:hypothetical protein